MAILGFVPAIMATTKAPAKPPLPVFSPRFWYRADCLDARSIIWSLNNHPEEWEYHGERYERYIIHTPSKHILTRTFSMAAFRTWDWEIRAECSCSGHHYQFGQIRAVNRAVRNWLRNHHHDRMAEQFAAHFVHE